MKYKKHLIPLLALLICILCSFSGLAAEGMVVTGSDGKTEVRYYYFDGDGSYLKSQWKQVWDNWYYFGEDGKSKQNTWAEIDGKWYYFSEWSVMLSDTTTPDGYYVGADGVWAPGAGEDGQ